LHELLLDPGQILDDGIGGFRDFTNQLLLQAGVLDPGGRLFHLLTSRAQLFSILGHLFDRPTYLL
jgi:hypothetical protein